MEGRRKRELYGWREGRCFWQLPSLWKLIIYGMTGGQRERRKEFVKSCPDLWKRRKTMEQKDRKFRNM